MSRSTEPPLRPLQWATIGLGVALLLATAVAFAQGEFTEWKTAQRRYNSLARAAGKAPIAVRLRQIWKPTLDVVDRCTSCHVAMAGADPLPGQKLFSEHPPLPHDPREMGCTICHGGDGRATSALAAHGERDPDSEPMLAASFRDVGCGSCHTGVRTVSKSLAERGAEVYRTYDCQSCHTKEHSLQYIALQRLDAGWHERHLELLAKGVSFAPLADEEVPSVTEYLRTLVGAPNLIAGKQLFAERGCRGCHRVQGVGGEDGPDLTEIGRQRLDSLPSSTNRSLALVKWHTAHLLDPSSTVPGSKMPKLSLSRDQAEQLARYVVSLRPHALPESAVPKDRIRTALLGERDFPGDGASLFAAFCSACHGSHGEGRDLQDALGPVPSLNNPDALALADDAFLRRTVEEGRSGRRMQAWANHEGGLRPDEIQAIVSYLRSFEPPAISFETVMASPVDLDAGRKSFATLCTPCHGTAGEGSVVAPPLAATDNVVTIDDNRIYGTLTTGVAGTAMGAFRRLDASTLRSLIAAVRDLPRLPIVRKDWKPTPGNAVRGALLFAQHCEKCHGKTGQGDKGPALSNSSFLSAASDGFLAGTILRGRRGTKMPTFGAMGPENAKLDAGQVSDLVAFIRSKQLSAAPRAP